MIKLYSLFFVLMLFGAVTISASGFCACCVERGYYEVGQEKVDAYHLGMLEEMKFNASADLYMTEAGFDGIKGLPAVEADSQNEAEIKFDIVERFLRRTWTIGFTTTSGKKGTLTLPMPAVMTKFKFDTRDESNVDRGLGVSLYKQFTFTGKVSSGTGIFRPATARPPTYMLVFHGSGNGCDSSSDFHAWRLEFNGPRAQFAILGKLDVAGT